MKSFISLRQQSDEKRKRDRRKSLLNAAAKEFALTGFHKTLISDVVAKAGVGQGTFYRYFTSKREIFETLIDEFTGSLILEFSEMTSKLPTDVEEYRTASISAISRVAATIDQNREIAMLFLREAPAIDKEFETKMEGIYSQFEQLAGFYLQHAIAHGFARQCRTDVVARALIGIALRLIDDWLSDRMHSMSREQLIEEVVNFAFWGFGQEPASDPKKQLMQIEEISDFEKSKNE